MGREIFEWDRVKQSSDFRVTSLLPFLSGNSVTQGPGCDHSGIQRVKVVASVINFLCHKAVCDPVLIAHAEESISGTVVVVKLKGRIAEILFALQSDEGPGMTDVIHTVAMGQRRFDADLRQQLVVQIGMISSQTFLRTMEPLLRIRF